MWSSGKRVAARVSRVLAARHRDAGRAASLKASLGRGGSAKKSIWDFLARPLPVLLVAVDLWGEDSPLSAAGVPCESQPNLQIKLVACGMREEDDSCHNNSSRFTECCLNVNPYRLMICCPHENLAAAAPWASQRQHGTASVKHLQNRSTEPQHDERAGRQNEMKCSGSIDVW